MGLNSEFLKKVNLNTFCRTGPELLFVSMEGLTVADANLTVYVHPSNSKKVKDALLRQLSSLLFKYVIFPIPLPWFSNLSLVFLLLTNLIMISCINYACSSAAEFIICFYDFVLYDVHGFDHVTCKTFVIFFSD